MWFQPIVDTSDHQLVGHECISPAPGEGDWNAIQSVQATHEGLYFVGIRQASIGAALRRLDDAGIISQDLVFQIPCGRSCGRGLPCALSCGDARGLDLLRTRGIAIALDQVGSEPHCLPLVRELRPDYLKLDARMARCSEDPVSAATIQKLVELADKHHIKIIARGVDRPQTVENLWLLGVEIMQGDVFGRRSPQIIERDSSLAGFAHALRSGFVIDLPRN